MEKNKVYLSWKWVDEQINTIGDKLEGLNLEFVAGIPRGGLIPAVMMSHAFGIKYISYSSAKMLPGDLRKKTLVVDDISDTGVTIAEADKLKFITATLCIRVGTKTVPYFSGEHINDDRWLVFPWEKLDSVPMQDYLVDKK
jgi:hypoxanthine phosphoribosyltransferase|tara:strand:+ start:54 stop:476 length:423 start_codon:yes stop_codon:yes gene_type:complete